MDDEVLLQLLCEVLLALFFLAGAAANSTALLVFYRRPALRNRFVINLLCTNLVSTCALLPVTLLDVQGEGVAAGVCTGSVLAVLLVALDQYCAVVDPLRYHARISKARCAVLVVGAWALAVLCGALQAAGEWTGHRVAVAAVIFALVFVLPFGAILWMYVCIYAAAHGNSERTRRTGSGPIAAPAVAEEGPIGSLKYRISNASLFRYREETRAARISALVIVMALVCWLPYVAVLGLHVPRYVRCFCLTLLLSATVVSPCLFAFRNRRIQRETRRLLWRRRDRDRRLPPHRQQLLTARISLLSSCVAQEKGEVLVLPESALTVDTCRSSFSSGGTSSTVDTD